VYDEVRSRPLSIINKVYEASQLNPVPADARLLKVTDLQVRESALTGESLPVEKSADDLPSGKYGIADASNSVFLGTALQAGIGTAVIVLTGRAAFGEIAERLAMQPPGTEFARGIRHFGIMLTWITMLLVLFVLLVTSSSTVRCWSRSSFLLPLPWG
jgi:P-type Mg2+ transporter